MIRYEPDDLDLEELTEIARAAIGEELCRRRGAVEGCGLCAGWSPGVIHVEGSDGTLHEGWGEWPTDGRCPRCAREARAFIVRLAYARALA